MKSQCAVSCKYMYREPTKQVGNETVNTQSPLCKCLLVVVDLFIALAKWRTLARSLLCRHKLAWRRQSLHCIGQTQLVCFSPCHHPLAWRHQPRMSAAASALLQRGLNHRHRVCAPQSQPGQGEWCTVALSTDILNPGLTHRHRVRALRWQSVKSVGVSAL